MEKVFEQIDNLFVNGVINGIISIIIAGIVLIVLSIILTLLGGIIPSKKAAKEDPVTALRTD